MYVPQTCLCPITQDDAAAAAAAAAEAAGTKGGKPGAPAAKKDAKGGKGGAGASEAGPEVPEGHRLEAAPELAPTHIIDLEVGGVVGVLGRTLVWALTKRE